MLSVNSKRKRSALRPGVLWLSLCLSLCGLPAAAQSEYASISRAAVMPAAPLHAEELFPPQQPDQPASGTVTGKVVDQSGTAIGGATVKLTRDGQLASPQVITDEDGQFYFTNIAPGRLQLSISSDGLASQNLSVDLHVGQVYAVPKIILVIPIQMTEVRVGLTKTELTELADTQIKEEEKQRVFYFIPNFYVTYNPNAVPLNARQKFRLAWKSMSDPITLAGVGALAGVDQATNRWGAYGQGFSGYAKRFGAGYGNVAIGTYLGSAVLPTILKQDPRYFYRGTGSKRSRLMYALSRSVICKGDNGRWQPNYSNIGGNFAAAGFAHLYYPPNDRNGANSVLSVGFIRIAETALANVFQEFVVPRWTPSVDSSSLPSNLSASSATH
jgi:hypothetical protein